MMSMSIVQRSRRMRTRHVWIVIGVTLAAALLGPVIGLLALQTPIVRSVDEQILHKYTGVYRWDSDAFVYLQMWNEFSGFANPGGLTAFDESGEVRTLYPTGRDLFLVGSGAAVPSSIEARVEFQRDEAGQVVSLTWTREGGVPRTARRVHIEKQEDVRFSNGTIQLAGTLISPNTGGKHPAVILVHGSGAENREFILPFARFLVRHGMAILGYDKRGVGGSTGDWNTASFDELAGDVLAAFEYLKMRPDIDSGQIGLLGVSQAGWIMPLAAIRAKDIAFLISVSGAGITAEETTMDQARNEMTAAGRRPAVIEQIIGLMKLQHKFARTGEGWEEYAAAREAIGARIGGTPPDTFPGSPDHPSWQFIRRLYFYDPAPTLRQLQVPTLAIFGELDNNIMAEKNKAAWEMALKAGGNRDHTLRILPRANHLMLEAKTGSNAEMASLRQFVQEYYTTILDWLAKRVRGFDTSR